jgi:hypothetical protein
MKPFFCQTLLILWLNSGLLESPSPKNQKLKTKKEIKRREMREKKIKKNRVEIGCCLDK